MPIEALHGNLIEIFNQGIHLYGPSKVGKSSLTYQLVTQGHQFISDDISYYHLGPGNAIIGRACEEYADLIYLPESGIIDIKQKFGDKSSKHQTKLSLIINLERREKQDLRYKKNKPKITYRLILGKRVPELTLTYQACEQGAVYIEEIVKTFFSLENNTKQIKVLT